MGLLQQHNTPGEHALTLQGAVGPLEACLTVPEVRIHSHVAILGHPHSLQGGTMNNKVVTTMARAFKALGIASLRFNFRGVGASAGVYDVGCGESDDMLLLARQCTADSPGLSICFAGFSFGSYVAYRAAAQHAHALLITVAPSVQNYDYQEYTPRPQPWLIFQGEADEVVAYAHVLEFAKRCDLRLEGFVGVGHFFHGQLIPFKARLQAALIERLDLRPLSS